MKVRASLVVFLGALLIAGTLGMAQEAGRGARNASMAPCPGGTAAVEIDNEGVPALEFMVEASDLILVGTVVNVLPAILSNPNSPKWTETHSLISIREHLHGLLPPNTNAILLTQEGGKVGTCAVVVPADPLVKFNEEYVLFLKADRRTSPPHTPGPPRYAAVGVWNGKAKIVNGKIEFLPRANVNLHKYDKSDESDFIALVRRISAIFPKR